MSSPATTATNTVPFTVDNAIPGTHGLPESPDLYRIRIAPEHAGAGGPTIKYLAAPNTTKILIGPDAHFRRRNNLAFDRVPAGDWVVARLAAAEAGEHQQHGKLQLASIEPDTAAALDRLGLTSAEPTWCGHTIDIADCQVTTADRPSHATTTTTATSTDDKETPPFPSPTPLQLIDYPPSTTLIPTPASLLDNTPNPPTSTPTSILVTDWLPGHAPRLASESRAHERLAARAPGLAPRLLAHVTENGGRVIGFLLEHVPGAREAGVDDLEGCRAALRRLRAAGVGLLAGRVGREAFLVREGDGAVMVRGPFVAGESSGDGDGDGGEDEDVVLGEEEEGRLEEVLRLSPSVLEEQTAKIARLVDPRRVEVLQAFERAHGVVLPFVYWQESSAGGGRITLTVEEHGELVREYEENGFRWTGELQEKAEKRFGPSTKGA